MSEMETTVSDDIVCVICNISLSVGDITTVHKKGLQRLIEVSKVRQDNLHLTWLNRENDKLHTRCRVSYINPGNIAATSNRLIKKRKLDNEEEASTSSAADLTNFNYETHCLICGKVCSVEYESRKSQKKTLIHEIKKKSTVIETIRKAAEKIDDELSATVKSRLSGFKDFPDRKAVYHGPCLSKFIIRRPKSHNFVATSSNREYATEFLKVCEKLKKESHKQHVLDDLYNLMGEKAPTKYYFTKLLKNHFGDDLIFSSVGPLKTILTFKAECHSILVEHYYSKNANLEEQRLHCVVSAAKILREDIKTIDYVTDNYPSSSEFFKDVINDIPDSLQTFLNILTSNPYSKDNKTANVDATQDCEESGEDTADDIYDNQEVIDGDQQQTEKDSPVVEEEKDNKQQKRQKIMTKLTSIAHTIISIIRPAFISCVQLSLSVYLHRKYGSKLLIDIVSRMGFGATYQKTILYRASTVAALNDQLNMTNNYSPNSFFQFIFDNVDHTVSDADGKGSLHALAGIRVLTPADGEPPMPSIKKLDKIPKAAFFELKGKIPTVIFQRQQGSSLQSLPLIDVLASDISTEAPVILPPSEVLWVSGYFLNIVAHPSWIGFMELHTSTLSSQISKINYLPFINLKAASADAINTALCYVNSQKHYLQQASIPVTCDQPLYMLTKDIIASSNKDEFNSIIPRLGGFHLLMSYFGALGHIMKGSGLQELWMNVYASNSTINMMSGKSYSRAVRAHFLTQAALLTIVLQECQFTAQEIEDMKLLLESKGKKSEVTIQHLISEAIVDVFNKKLNATLDEFEARGKTAQLWVQYIKLISIVRSFIDAEKSANWNLHLSSIQQMIPIFHSGGRWSYVKSTQIYLQDMLNLQETMADNSRRIYNECLLLLDNEIADKTSDLYLRKKEILDSKLKNTSREYQKFTTEGCFTIRRSKKFYSGIWSDMTIEQTMMRTFSIEGVAVGRGATTNINNSWVLSLPCSVEVCLALEEFVGVYSESSEQHKSLRASSINRDTKDLQTFVSWLKDHPPFPKTEKIISLSTGITGAEDVNCHEAVKIGLDSYKAMFNGPEITRFGDVKLKKLYKVIPIPDGNCTMKIKGQKIQIDSSLLFQRMIGQKYTQLELKDFFTYELCPYPQTLFDENGLRKSTTNFFTFFTKFHDNVSRTNFYYVVDGEYLLKHINWTLPNTYADIFSIYINYLHKYFGKNNFTVVLEDYDDVSAEPSVAVRFKNILPKSNDIQFTEAMNATHNKDKLFTNRWNKSRFIKLFYDALTTAGIDVYLIKSNKFDFTIVKKTVEVAQHHNYGCLVSDNVDLLVLLIHYCTLNEQLFFFRPSTGRKKKDDCYSVTKFVKKFPYTAFYLPLLHSLTGCRITSSLFKIGKASVINDFEKSMADDVTRENFKSMMDIFYKRNAVKPAIIREGEALLLRVYKVDEHHKILDSARFFVFDKIKNKTKTEVNLASLPPTSDSASFHCLRVYYQMQQWLGNVNIPTEFGWRTDLENWLQPYQMTKDPVPEKLLTIISCGCTGDCNTKQCTCKKSGFLCTSSCKNCAGITCLNCTQEPEVTVNENEDSDDEEVMRAEKELENALAPALPADQSDDENDDI